MKLTITSLARSSALRLLRTGSAFTSLARSSALRLLRTGSAFTSLARSSALRLLRTGSAWLLAGGAVAALSALALAQAPAPPAPGDKTAAGKQAFVEVARVLQSPRCQNCHPAGDRPLQGDQGKPHAQNISRASVAAGLPCSTCHQERNSDAIGVVGGPPGAPRWGLPPAEHPMVFQGRTPRALCEQLKDPKHNGGKTLAQLLEHVSHDPLVLWGWKPGGGRATPPLAHDRFVAAFTAWVASNGACP